MKHTASRTALLIFCLVLSACASRRNRRQSPDIPEEEYGLLNEPLAAPAVQKDAILDYRGKAGGSRMPQWFEAYLDGGVAAVEELNDYRGLFVFVSENWGVAPAPLEQWLQHFDVERGFSRLAAVRLRFRFIRGLDRSADAVYGKNYENAVKAAYDVGYSGYRRGADFWIREESAGEYGAPASQYRYFILITVPRGFFMQQTYTFLNRITVKDTARSQDSAFDSVREHFFEGY